MDLVKLSIRKPVTVIVGVLLILLFGEISLFRMPYQLSPTVTEPEITVTTIWPGATPYEIERDIVEEQEEVLKGIPNLVEMESSSYNGQGEITLRFRVGTDVDEALLRVSNNLDEVPSYPENVEKPIINATGAATSPVIWNILKTNEGNPNHIYTYRTFFEDEVRQYLERVEGVADLFVGGGVEREMHVILEPTQLAAHGLTFDDVVNVLRAANINVSAGNLGVGRREYRIRTVAQFNTPEEIERVVVKTDGQRRITVKDVGQVKFGYEKTTVPILHNGTEGIAIGIQPEPGTNILDLTDRAEEAVNWLNENVLAPEDIHLEWVYDQRPYINGAIGLVKQNILIGGILAIIVLLVYLRSVASTLVVGVAIPISIVGTFIFLNGFGRNLNVVSLAGIAFAVGMLVDNAIVVLENIDRHRKMGKRPFAAAYDGAREVWGAVFASTMTTIAVFLPVVFIQQEAGQLFKDIAIAVSCAVFISLFVSVSVIPSFSKQLYALMEKKPIRPPKHVNIIVSVGNALVSGIMAIVRWTLQNWVTRLVTVFGLVGMAVGVFLLLFPPMEYLPTGNRNLIINLLVPPPGLSYEERKGVGEFIFQETAPYFGKDHYNGFPGIDNMFYVGADRIMLFGAISTQEQEAGQLIPLFQEVTQKIPGIFAVSQQASIFETRLGRGRTIDVDIRGNDINRLVQVGGVLFGKIMGSIPEVQIRPLPSLELLYPEISFVPDRERLRAVGMSARDLGVAIDILMDGRKTGEFKQEGKKKIDLVVMASEEDVETPEELKNQLIATPRGQVVPVSALAEIDRSAGLTQIRHLERDRTITLQVTPPTSVTIQDAMDTIQGEILPDVEKMGLLEGLRVRLSGTADKLTETRQILQFNFILAALITYLLMSALFGNFLYPFIIMFTVPLAGAGGLIGLKLVNLLLAPQPLDILTMLGFVILIGVVVNNAILIVYQALNNIRNEGMEYKEAVLESVRTRIRPIYMSATTSIFGMLPLVVLPGPGSELYRGLGSVVLGGILFSTVFTVFLIPSLLTFAIRMEKRPGEGDNE